MNISIDAYINWFNESIIYYYQNLEVFIKRYDMWVQDV